MARVGLANFKLSAASAASHDQVYREALNREQWDHLYHSLRTQDPKRKYNYRSAQTESQEKMNKTWHTMGSIYSSAAGQASYHYNQMKPVGNVQAYFPSASFSYVPKKYAQDQQELLRNAALRQGAQGAGEHLTTLWASIGCNARYGGGVRSKSQDLPYAHMNADGYDCRPQKNTVPGDTYGGSEVEGGMRNGQSNHHLYNETYYGEGHYNSDKFNKHDNGMRGRIRNKNDTNYRGFSQPHKTRNDKWIDRFNKWHTNINARSTSQMPDSNRPQKQKNMHNSNNSKSNLSSTFHNGFGMNQNTSNPNPNQNAGPAGPSSNPGSSNRDYHQGHGGGATSSGSNAMAKTWHNGFRDAHGAENPYRCDPSGYDQGAGRFDQIRDNRPTKIYARSGYNSSGLGAHGNSNSANGNGNFSSRPDGLGKTLHNNNARFNSENQRFNSLSPSKDYRNPKEDHLFLDVQGDPSVTNPNKRYSHTVAGPFFHPTTSDGPSGGLNGNSQASQNGVAKNRVAAGSLTRDGAPGRRVNQQNAPSFNRVLGI